MSDLLSDLLASMKHFEPAELHRVLLGLREELDEPRRPRPGASEASQSVSFDELDAWARARRLRARADAQRLSQLLDDSEAPELLASDEPPSPPVVGMSLNGGRGNATIELVNDTPWPVEARVVTGHGALRDGSPVAVELQTPQGQPLGLGAGEVRSVTLELRTEPSDAHARTLVPVEIHGEDEVLARVWIDATSGPPQAGPDPRVSLRRGVGPQLRVLSRLRRALLVHPEASRALYGALVAEGERFAETDAGRTWAVRLATSPKMRRLRLAWEVLSLSTLEGAARSESVPSAWMDALFALAGRGDMEDALGRLSTPVRGG